MFFGLTNQNSFGLFHRQKGFSKSHQARVFLP